MYKWTLALPRQSQAQQKIQASLSQEVEKVTKQLGQTSGLSQGEYVLCHCDLLSGNVIVRPHSGTTTPKISDVSFIDYEYTSPGPAAFDLANHFSEWAGFECKYANIPTRSQRRAFTECYVESYERHTEGFLDAHMNGDADLQGESTRKALQASVEQLMRDVDNFKGIPGLYWGIWALIQADISQIDFDYESYAEKRLAEYWSWRAEKDGTQTKLSSEQALREQRWQSE